VQDADVLIVRSRTKVNQALLQDSQVKFVGSTVAGLKWRMKSNNIRAKRCA
jgi:erythronate-4-phosphate dehydrogenase